MKWTTQEPLIGNRRTDREFIWWPTTLPRPDGTMETHWLEMASVVKIYCGVYHPDADGNVPMWVNACWAD